MRRSLGSTPSIYTNARTHTTRRLARGPSGSFAPRTPSRKRPHAESANNDPASETTTTLVKKSRRRCSKKKSRPGKLLSSCFPRKAAKVKQLTARSRQRLKERSGTTPDQAGTGRGVGSVVRGARVPSPRGRAFSRAVGERRSRHTPLQTSPNRPEGRDGLGSA